MLHMFAELVPDLLMDNYTVHLKPLGVFSLSFKRKSVESHEDIGFRVVMEVRMQFRPNPEVKGMLMNIEVKRE